MEHVYYFIGVVIVAIIIVIDARSDRHKAKPAPDPLDECSCQAM